VLESERAWLTLGEVRYGSSEAERMRLGFRRWIYASADIADGELFTRDNIRIVFPGYGTTPYDFQRFT